MSTTTDTPAGEPTPRVRELAREQAVLMLVSLVLSSTVALGFLLLASLGH